MAVTVENGYKISEVPLMSAEDIDGKDLFIVADNDGDNKFHSRSMQAAQLAKFIANSDDNKTLVDQKIDEKTSQLNQSINDTQQSIDLVQENVQNSINELQTGIQQTASDLQNVIQQSSEQTIQTVNGNIEKAINENVTIQKWLIAEDEDEFILSCGAS